MDYQTMMKEEKLVINLEKKFLEICIDGKPQKFRLKLIKKVPRKTPSKKRVVVQYTPANNTYSDEESE